VSEGTEKKKKFPKYDQTQGLISTKEEYWPQNCNVTCCKLNTEQELKIRSHLTTKRHAIHDINWEENKDQSKDRHGMVREHFLKMKLM
jgi:hypothetical protein